MLKFWNYFEKKNWKKHNKYRVYFFVLMLVAGIMGYGSWLFVSLFALKTMDWMICFIGYPTMFFWFIGYLYTCNHEFHDGAK